jgi:hypothetical protein
VRNNPEVRLPVIYYFLQYKEVAKREIMIHSYPVICPSAMQEKI